MDGCTLGWVGENRLQITGVEAGGGWWWEGGVEGTLKNAWLKIQNVGLLFADWFVLSMKRKWHGDY